MRVFLYEFVTGGGMYSWGENPSGSLLTEGQAMLSALAADLDSVTGLSLHGLRDARLSPFVDWPQALVANANDEPRLFRAAVQDADLALIIAPEIDGALAERCKWAEDSDTPVYPNNILVEQTADKNKLQPYLQTRGIAVPRGQQFTSVQAVSNELSSPFVLKRSDGAGALGTRLAPTLPALPQNQLDGSWRLEEFVPGQAVSVTVLTDGKRMVACPVFTQEFTDDGTFTYQGGNRVMDSALIDRAQRLACRTISTLANAVGLIGVDIILAEAPEQDCVVDVNPRLTTSFVGLRALTSDSLGLQLVNAFLGRSWQVHFSNAPLEFRASGEICRPALDS